MDEKFRLALDDIDDNIEIMLDDYVDKYGENEDLKKVFYKNSTTVNKNKALAHFAKVVMVPYKKIYGK